MILNYFIPHALAEANTELVNASALSANQIKVNIFGMMTLQLLTTLIAFLCLVYGSILIMNLIKKSTK